MPFCFFHAMSACAKRAWNRHPDRQETSRAFSPASQTSGREYHAYSKTRLHHLIPLRIDHLLLNSLLQVQGGGGCCAAAPVPVTQITSSILMQSFLFSLIAFWGQIRGSEDGRYLVIDRNCHNLTFSTGEWEEDCFLKYRIAKRWRETETEIVVGEGGRQRSRGSRHTFDWQW